MGYRDYYNPKVYTELMIEYGRAAGLETRELEEYLAMYELLN